jgi:hypothetical protein
VIPEKAIFSPIKQILLASDFEKISEKSLYPLKLICESFDSTLNIVYINNTNRLTKNKTEEAKKFEQYFKNTNNHYHIIKNEDVEKGLKEFMEKHDTDLFALIPRKHPLFDQVFGGGESKNLILHSKMPILALPEIY